MNEDEHTIKTDYLSVGDRHKVYYQQWGNPKAKPIFFLHGGPGAGCNDRHKLGFDPKSQQVVFHDQRGSGKSTPFGKLENNTTQDLVSDIDKLRTKLFGKNQRIQLFGGSWGSCLSLVYAIAHPDAVDKMLINGIYTGTIAENDYIMQGGLSTHFPESYEQLIEIVPKNKRSDVVGFYFQKMKNKSKKISDEHIRRWNINEGSAMFIDADLEEIAFRNKEVKDEGRSIAILEAHYFAHDMFLEPDFINKHVNLLKKIPIVMVQGRHDHVCPPKTAYELSKQLGRNCRLHITPGSHAKEGAFREVIRAYTWSFLD